jgi:hypothetical protein
MAGILNNLVRQFLFQPAEHVIKYIHKIYNSEINGKDVNNKGHKETTLY